MSPVLPPFVTEKNAPECATAALRTVATNPQIALSRLLDAFCSFSLRVLVPFVHSSAWGSLLTPRDCFLFIPGTMEDTL